MLIYRIEKGQFQWLKFGDKQSTPNIFIFFQKY